MYEENFNKRFTYSKTKGFWDIIEKAESSYSVDSLDFTVIKRDKIIFQLFYSYGLRTAETLCLSSSDFNFNEVKTGIESYGSIFISAKSTRLVYPIFSEVTKEIKTYLEMHNLFFRATDRSNIFTTTKGNVLTVSYLNSRLKLYNSKLPTSKRIDSLNAFRQYYIADLLRIEGISQSFINNQIGNNIINNQVYLHLLPNKDRIGVST